MPVHNDGDLELDHKEGDSKVDSTLGAQAHQQIMIALQQSGNIAQNNFITIQKIVDYDYMENKRMVTLDEAVGIREVSPGPWALEAAKTVGKP